MRILILADHWGELGGGEVVAAQLAHALRERFELAVLTTDRQRDSQATRDGLRIYRIRSRYPARLRPVAGLVNPLVLARVRRVLADFKPELVHAWNVHQHLSYASLALARSLGAATVLTFQDALPFCHTKYHCYIDSGAPCPNRPSYAASPRTCRSCRPHYWLFPPRNRTARGLLNRFLDRKVAVSHALAEALADNGLPGAQVIHNGLPLSGFPPPETEVSVIRERFGLSDEVTVAGGRMGYFKGQQIALEAFAKIAAERPAAQLALAGRTDDWFARSLRARADELGLEHRVVFTDFLPRRDFLALLGASALFANLSVYLDPFPTVNLEAAAAERPVLGTCFGGTPEAVFDGETGWIVNPYDLDQTSAALLELLASRDRRLILGKRAAERVRRDFSMCAMADSYATLFHSLR